MKRDDKAFTTFQKERKPREEEGFILLPHLHPVWQITPHSKNIRSKKTPRERAQSKVTTPLQHSKEEKPKDEMGSIQFPHLHPVWQITPHSKICPQRFRSILLRASLGWMKTSVNVL